MIHNVNESKTKLSDFLMKRESLNELNISELIQDNSINAYLNCLYLEDIPSSSIIFENLEQQPYFLSGNITNLNLDNLKYIESTGSYTINSLTNLPMKFLHHTKLQTLNLPRFQGARTPLPTQNSVQITNSEASQASFWNNYWLKDVGLGENVKEFHKNSRDRFNGFWFNNNYSLLSLRLYYPYLLEANRALTGLENTPIGKGNGYIYVPDNLVSVYQEADYWGAYQTKILPLSSYNPNNPNLGYDSIKKSWNEIISDCATGNLDTNIYKIGATKTLLLKNGIPIQMQIVRIKGNNSYIDANDRMTSDPTKFATITWMCKAISLFDPLTNLKINDDNTLAKRNYGDLISTASLRQVLNNYLNQFPDELKDENGIKTVIKNSYGYDSGTSTYIASNERLWIPSSKELNINIHDPNNIYRAYDFNFEIKLGETNIKTEEIIIRDFSGNNASYLDSIRYDSTQNQYVLNSAGASSPYLMFCFCT